MIARVLVHPLRVETKVNLTEEKPILMSLVVLVGLVVVAVDADDDDDDDDDDDHDENNKDHDVDSEGGGSCRSLLDFLRFEIRKRGREERRGGGGNVI